MSMLFNGLQLFAPNTKIPGITQHSTFRCSWTTTAGGSNATVAYPTVYQGPGQIDISQNATTFALTSSPFNYNSEFQRNQRFIITNFLIRDVAASSVQGATATGTIAIQTNATGAFANLSSTTQLPTAAAYASGPNRISYVAITGNNIANSDSNILSYNTAMQVVITAGTNQTAGLQGAVTIDLFGTWTQAM